MTYQQFLDFISNGCIMFINGFYSVANSLMTNYIFITLLGISIFVSLLYFFMNNYVFNLIDKVRGNCDDFIDSKRRYNLYHEVRYNFLQTNEKDCYLYRMANLKLNRNIFDNYLSENKDLEFSIKFKQLDNYNQVYRIIKSTNDNDEKVFNHWQEVIYNKVPPTDDEVSEMNNIIQNF